MTITSSMMHRSPAILYKYHTEDTDSLVLEAQTNILHYTHTDCACEVTNEVQTQDNT